MRTSRLLADLFQETRPLIGMVHLQPLPGSPRWAGSMADVIDRAVEDATCLVQGGMDGLMVENYLDAPFFPGRVPPESVAALAVVVQEVARVSSVPIGVNMLRNDGPSALAVAVATGAQFIRVNVHCGAMLGDQGWLLGEAHETVRMRSNLSSQVAILADVLVKHATPPQGIDVGQAARDAWDRGLADGLIVSGLATGAMTDIARIQSVQEACPEAPVWVGSGVAPENVTVTLQVANGAIVGTCLMKDGAGSGVDPKRVKDFLSAAGRS